MLQNYKRHIPLTGGPTRIINRPFALWSIRAVALLSEDVYQQEG